MENIWMDRAMLEDVEVPRNRSSDSSVDPQYEDSIPGDDGWELDNEAS